MHTISFRGGGNRILKVPIHPMRGCPIINHPPAQSRISFPPSMCLGHALPAHTYATVLSCPCVVEGCQSRGRGGVCECSVCSSIKRMYVATYVRLDGQSTTYVVILFFFAVVASYFHPLSNGL